MSVGQISKREIWKTICCFYFDMDADEGAMVQDLSATIIISAIFVMIVNTHDSEWALARKPPNLTILLGWYYYHTETNANPPGRKGSPYQSLEYCPRS